MTKPVPCYQYDNDETLRFQHLRNRIGNAWKCFYEKAYNMIIPKLKFKHNLQLEDMENIFQEKIISLCKNIENGQFDDPAKRRAKFTTILYGYCEYGVIDFRRGMNGDNVPLEDIVNKKMVENEDEQPPVFDDIERALRQLSEFDQKIIRMRNSLEMSYEDMSIELGIPIENLRKYYSRAIKRLRDILRNL